MLFPFLIDHIDDQFSFEKSFILSSILTIFFGCLFLCTFFDKYSKLSIREMYLTTTIVWLVVCFFAALPFYFSPLNLSFTDAFFESMSGLTTTGASIFQNFEELSRGIILWISILQWIGGIGIIVIALGILPLLRIGGMQLFSMENSDKSKKNMPKTSQLILTMLYIYITYTVSCFLLLFLDQHNLFTSLIFALTTIPTGGFSPTVQSASELSAYSQWIIILFMFISGLPILIFYSFSKQKLINIKNDIQIKTYIFTIIIISFLLYLWLNTVYPTRSFFFILRQSVFTVVSVLTSTCLTIENIDQWGTFPILLLIFLMPVGSCSGSTSGGIKMFRINIIFLFSIQYLRHKIMPHAVFVSKYNDLPINSEITSSIFVFIAIFLITFLFSTLSLSCFSLDFMTSTTSVLSALSNSGLAFNQQLSLISNFSDFPSVAKWILAADMMLGRLEYISVFVVLLPLAWKSSFNIKKN